MTRARVSNWFKMPLLSSRRRAYGQTKKDFYESRIYLQNLDKLTSTLQSNHLSGLTTEKLITFYGIKFGFSQKDTIKKLGKPNFKSTEKKLFKDHKIIFYRLKISTVNCILQLHFVKDSFFLGVIEMRTGNKELKERLFDLIQQKYNIEDSVVNNFIHDTDGNRILVKEDVVPYVVYTTGNREIRAELINAALHPDNDFGQLSLSRRAMLLEMR